MMNLIKKHFLKTLFAVVAVTVTLSTYAGFWDWSTPYKGPDKDLITLIVTGNYTKSRMLAELIQLETKQPILLLPSQPDGKIFFVPAKGDALEIADTNFTNFVKFANPKKIVVLGNADYVPESYVNRIDKNQTVIRLQNDNWQETAERAEEMLKLKNVADDYKRLTEQIASGKLYKASTSAPAPTEEKIETSPVIEQKPVDTKQPADKKAEPAKEPILIEDTKVPQK